MDDTYPVECLATSNAHINIKYTAMKGIPRLVPIDKPVEGMQVVYSGYIERIEIVGGIGNEDGIHLEYFDAGDWCEPSELKQIVIEYNIYDGDGDDKIGVDTLPLHSEDYQACISKIGEEIEFEQTIPIYALGNQIFAKLILPEQEESWSDIAIRFNHYRGAMGQLEIWDWFKENYYLPIKRKQ